MCANSSVDSLICLSQLRFQLRIDTNLLNVLGKTISTVISGHIAESHNC
jgi:hypothetical protein